MCEVAEASNYRGYRYRIEDILTVMLLGMFCGLKTTESIYHWSETKRVRLFLKEEFSIERLPKKSQFYNILTMVNHKQFAIEFEKWIQAFAQDKMKGVTVAIDGKAICSTAKLSHDNKVLTIASAMITNSGIVIASKECKNKEEGEIGAFREIIRSLSIENAVVVADALHCQKKSAQAVVDAKADYLFVVKDNHKNLRESVELVTHNQKIDEHTTTDKNGGRIEVRTAYVTHKIENIGDHKAWPKLACAGSICREVDKKGEKTTTWHYYISSKKMTAEELLFHARAEWGIESMHWLLDVHFLEDKTRVRDMELQKNLNIIRKSVLSLAKCYQASLEKHRPISRILEANLFEIEHLSEVIAYFRSEGKSE